MKSVITEFVELLELKFKERFQKKAGILKRKHIFLYGGISLSSLLVIYLLFGQLLFKNEPIHFFLLKWNAVFISYIFSLATGILSYFGLDTFSETLTVYLNNVIVFSGISGYKAYRWVMLVLIIVWLSPSSARKKLYFSFIIFVLTFFAYLSKTMIWIGLVQSIIEDTGNAIKIGHVVIHLTYFFLVYFWLKLNKAEFKKIAEKVNPGIFLLIKQKYKTLLVLFLIIILFNNIGMAVLSFNSYIHFIFTLTQKGLSILNYESIVDGPLLIGNNGSIFMAKFCLGINTMIVFSSIIWITGKNILKRLFYIMSGLILINVLNILRFVLLFIHLQKHGSYQSVMDFHDIFDYCIYIFIFILWVIWLERFSDIWDYLKQEGLESKQV